MQSAYDTLPASFPGDVPAVDIAIMHQLRDAMFPRKYQTLGEDIYRILHGAVGGKLKLDHAPNRPIINQLITHMVLVHMVQQIKPGIYEIDDEETAVHNLANTLIDNLLYDLLIAITLPNNVLSSSDLQRMIPIVLSLTQLYKEKIHQENETGLMYVMERVQIVQKTALEQQASISEPGEELEWILTISQQLIATTDYILDHSQAVPLPLMRYAALIAGNILFLKNQASRHIPWLSRQRKGFKEWQNQLDALAKDYFHKVVSLCAAAEQRQGKLPATNQIRLLQ